MMWIKREHVDLHRDSSRWCPQKQFLGLSSPSVSGHPGLCSTLRPWSLPAASSSPIGQQEVLAGHGDALLRVYGLFYDERFRLLVVRLDGLSAQGVLAAAETEGTR